MLLDFNRKRELLGDGVLEVLVQVLRGEGGFPAVADELDALAPCRAASQSELERQATARLLAAVDALRASRARVGLVGATNRREAVDPALRRSGRLDCEVGSLGGTKEPLGSLPGCLWLLDGGC